MSDDRHVHGAPQARPKCRALRGPRVAYRARILSPIAGAASLVYHDRARLVVGADGSIESIDVASEEAPFDGVVHDLGSSLVIPALIDAHLHFPQTRVIGSATGQLLDWLEHTVFPEEARFADAVYARTVAHEFVDHALRFGTGTIGAFSSSSAVATSALFDVMLETGIRGVAGVTLMDARCPEALAVSADRALAEARELADRYHGADEGRLEFAVTPRFALSCSEALMRSAGELARERGLAVQTHVAENEREGVETRAAFPWAKDYLDVYDALGLLGPRTILAHAIHLSDDEWDRVAARGASVAHCPDSNAFLGSGRMHLARATTRGITAALGSDVAAGRTFDMRRAIASAYDTALGVGAPQTPEALLRIATLGGAEALGFADRTGSIEPGKDADFVVLDTPSYLEGREGALRAACFGSEIAPVRRTYVRGRLVYRA